MNNQRSWGSTAGKRDLILVAFVTLIAFAAAAHYDVYERVAEWIIQYEVWQADEAITLLAVWTVAFGVFAARRWVELRREIDLRQRLEQARIESEERYRILVDLSPDAVTLTTLDGEIVMANQRAAEMMGFASPELMAGMSTYDLIAPETHAQTREDAERLLREGTLRDLDYTLVKADGETRFPAETSVSIIRGLDGQPEYALGVLRDITERVQADQDRKRHILGLEIMHQVDRATLTTCSPAEIAAAVLRHLRALLGPGARMNAVVIDWSTSTAVVLSTDVSGHAHWSAGARVPLEYVGDLAGLRQGQILVADDLSKESQTTLNPEMVRALDIHACLIVPMLVEDELVGTINVVFGHAQTFDRRDIQIVRQAAAALAVAVHKARLSQDLEMAHTNVRRLSAWLLEAQEMERQRIARELHDQVGQVLTAVKLNLQSLQRLPGIDGGSARLQDGIGLIDSAIGHVRNLSLDLRPSLLDDLGLVATLRWYTDREAQRGGLSAEFYAQPPEIALPPEVQVVAFRIVQEAVTNVLRHAQAERLCVHVSRSDEVLDLCIRDDGIGFDPLSEAGKDVRHEGLGLLGMRERAQLAGGDVRIDSEPGRGTSIHVCLPLSAVPELMPGGETEPGRMRLCAGREGCLCQPFE